MCFVCLPPQTLRWQKGVSKVVEIANELKIDLKPDDIEACHCLPSKNKDSAKRTIVRFIVNRKNCEHLLLNRKNFANLDMRKLKRLHPKLYINIINLCPFYVNLRFNFKLLFDDKLIFGFWTFGGVFNDKLIFRF